MLPFICITLMASSTWFLTLSLYTFITPFEVSINPTPFRGMLLWIVYKYILFIAAPRAMATSSTASSAATSVTSVDMDELQLLQYHLSLLEVEPQREGLEEARTTPIFNMPVLKHAEMISSEDADDPFPQYGLLAGMADELGEIANSRESTSGTVEGDPRIFFNIAAPSSIFICGSQGSGKSHTLSCLLENCLFSSGANNLPKPLCGIVFHYDNFFSDQAGSPCEAAFLASNPDIKVQVLCSPTNLRTMEASLTQNIYC